MFKLIPSAKDFIFDIECENLMFFINIMCAELCCKYSVYFYFSKLNLYVLEQVNPELIIRSFEKAN